MTSLSLIAIPVMLDTANEAPLLYQQWARTYHYGHQVLPGMAVATLLLYGYTAVRSKSTIYAVAGAVTVAMVPFTWIVMVPTNDELFAREAGSWDEGVVMELGEAQGLLRRWAWMHLVRSLFPLVGAVVGLGAALGVW